MVSDNTVLPLGRYFSYSCRCIVFGSVAALAALAGSQLRSPVGTGAGTQTHEMTVPNELIGCIIGKGGTKIAEIRYFTYPFYALVALTQQKKYGNPSKTFINYRHKWVNYSLVSDCLQ